jgi:23S rRNA pseudouridine2605 synthase
MAVVHARVIDGDNNAWVELTLHEGKHHEVKRLLEAVGHPVSKLKRVALGPLTLRGLEPGQFRALTEAEVKALRQGGAALRPRLPRPKPTRHVRHARPAAPASRGSETSGRSEPRRSEAGRSEAPRFEGRRSDGRGPGPRRAGHTRAGGGRRGHTRSR